PTVWRGDRSRSPRGPAPTARPANGYRRGSSPPRPVPSGAPWRSGPSGNGCGRGGVCTCSTAPRSRCPTRRRTRRSVRTGRTRGAGLGFPIARIGALISLACGAVVNLGFCRYAGKGQGEVSLLRQLWDVLTTGDVLVADRLTANWANIQMLQARGVELVSRLNKAHRKADFRRGRRLGSDDHIVRWAKPTSIRSLDREAYWALPESITVREARVRVAQPGFRTRSVVVVTTLLDPRQVTKEDLAALDRARLNAE